MRIYKIKVQDKTITVKRMKASKLTPYFITIPNAEFTDNDEVFVRCNMVGICKYYGDRQHIVYPVTFPVIKIYNYDNSIVRFIKKYNPFK